MFSIHLGKYQGALCLFLTLSISTLEGDVPHFYAISFMFLIAAFPSDSVLTTSLFSTCNRINAFPPLSCHVLLLAAILNLSFCSEFPSNCKALYLDCYTHQSSETALTKISDNF